MSKNYYDILGIDKSATAEEIKKAYYQRVKITHPDRFDPIKQKTEWTIANDMLKGLIEAYSVLGDGKNRQQYDNNYSYSSKSADNTEQKKEKHYVIKHHGTFDFRKLPHNVQENLLNIIKGKDSKYLVNSKENIYIDFILVTIGGGGACIIPYLFNPVNHNWPYWIYFIFTLLLLMCLLYIGVFSIAERLTGAFSNHKIIGPLYIIEINSFTVNFYTYRFLNNVQTAHKTKNFAYDGTEVKLKFSNGSVDLEFNDKTLSQKFLLFIKQNLDEWDSAANKSDNQYFVSHDIFYGCSDLIGKQLIIKSKTNIVAVVIAISCLFVSLYLASTIPINQNENLAQPLERTTQINESVAARPPQSTTDIASPPDVSQNAIHESKSELEIWYEKHPQKTLPKTGSIKKYITQPSLAPFLIHSTGEDNYIVLLKDAYTNAKALRVFVRGGRSVKIKVPLGEYNVFYASGTNWYGYKHRFGPETAFSQADQSFNFIKTSDGYSGYEITLYKVENGNLKTSSIDSTQFGDVE